MAKAVKPRISNPPKSASIADTICSGGEFSVVRSGDKYEAHWTNHSQVFESLDALKESGILNCHERLLLQFEVKETANAENNRHFLADLLSKARGPISDPSEEDLLPLLRDIMSSETRPNEITLLRIGRALVAARLDQIPPDIFPNNGTLAENDARQLFYVITRFEGSVEAPIFSDQAHAARTFKELEQGIRWLHVRDLLGRLVIQIRAELASRNPFTVEPPPGAPGTGRRESADGHAVGELEKARARMDRPNLRPDEFDFCGVTIPGFSSKQLLLLRLVHAAGSSGVSVPKLLEDLEYEDDVRGRKALESLRQRTQARMGDHRPPAGYLLETVNDHLCLSKNTG
jgi:hypothetical protein